MYNHDWFVLHFSIRFFFLYSWPMMEVSYELGVVLLSVLLPFWQFSLNCLISFFETLCVFIWNRFHAPKRGRWVNNGPKKGFSNLSKHLFNNFSWIKSIMKGYITCYIPAQISYLGKIWLVGYGPNCSWSMRLQGFKIKYISTTERWNSLIFLIEIHGNWKLIEIYWGGWGEKWLWPLISEDFNIGSISRRI